MTKEELATIQERIDYYFQNEDLLLQAFTRKSYAMENGGCDNEILEFIGDKVLDLIVVKYLSDSYGSYAHDDEEYDSNEDFDDFLCEYDEGELTDFKARLVQKKKLAYRIDLLGFADYLFMGQGDIDRHVERHESVKEDLFEAILGAVALDSNWDLVKLERVVDNMLCPDAELDNDDEYKNFIGQVQDWCTETAGALPQYHIEQNNSYGFCNVLADRNVILGEKARTLGSAEDRKYVCTLKLPGRDETFKEFGYSEYDARFGAAWTAYRFLEDNSLFPTIKDEIENPNYNDSIGQLETLSRRGYFSLPTYKYKETYDEDGNPIWACQCKVKEVDIVTNGRSSSKKDAKKQAAFDMLTYVLEEE